MITVATHNKKYHSDDAFAITTLMLALGSQMRVVRTRDPKILEAAQFRVDVGGKYDSTTGDFDHHQPGAPKRSNGIPYASFGLIWREYGSQICGGDQRVADYVDITLVCSVDAQDNGFSLYETETVKGIKPFTINDLFRAFNPDPEIAGADVDQSFMTSVGLARTFLEAQISVARQAVRDYEIIGRAIEKADDPRLIILEKECEWQYSLISQSQEALFLVCPYATDRWSVICVPFVIRGSHYRAYLPNRLAGLKDDALEKMSGIKGLKFCHRNLFVANASTREAAIALAKLAIVEHAANTQD